MKDLSLVASICPYCGVSCGLYIVVEDGNALGLEYKTNHTTNEGELCLKGNAALNIVYHREHLHNHLRRINGHYDRISWEDALDMISENLTCIRFNHGPDALGFLSSAKYANEENYLFQKLAHMLGTNNVDHCARL